MRLGVPDIFECHLGNSLDVLPTLDPVDAVVTDPPYGLKFMGKNWDHGVPGVPYWLAIMAAMKPGAHLLAFGGTRTYHRLTCAIEDAGFEIRDCIMWVYGSGFPKSHDIGKAIDRAAGVERTGGAREWRGGKRSGGISHGGGQTGTETLIKYDTPATPEAQQWDGWGTALKPAWEPIIVARKPLIGTGVSNVLEHGTGGINIDGCRVPLDGENPPMGSAKRVFKNNQYTDQKIYGDNTTTPNEGRFPANLIHDGSDEVVELFPQSSTTGKRSPQSKSNQIDTNLFLDNHESTEYPGDSGTAARFFYCAKTSKADRNEGLEDPGYQFKQGVTLQQIENTKTKGNNHPTVKPTALMRYLIKLVTPPGGVLLDPFAGSFSTGKAAILENFKFIGIEKVREYFNIGYVRCAAAYTATKDHHNETSI